ncbi:MAG: peptidoglycan DD-metalloendopeptidase family protein [Prevotella sp.]|jgi:murein DD-endopeptidase MepM/ murein hydrolase activator NlpD
MKRKILISFTFLLLLLTSLTTNAQQKKFSDAEQQQISIATPGLFARGNSFEVNFGELHESDYSFPLPVGKASLAGSHWLEIVTTKGDAVKAMFSGTVRLSRKHPNYGNVIVVRHDNGLETLYAHNAQNLVKVGDRVRAGQTVAIVGGVGDKVSCLFAVMVNGDRINPATLLEVSSHRLRRQIVRFSRSGSRVDISVIESRKNRGTTLDPDIEDENPFENSNTFKLDLSKLEQSHWAYPLAGSHVISPYGGRRHHGGVDIKTHPNDEIVAAFDGVVTRSGPYYGYGNCIVIRHAYGFETLYSHQSKNFVKKGQHVKAGTVIGLTGRTGRATTAHLHFEVHFKGHRINPNLLFNHTNKRLQVHTLTLTKSGSVRKSSK